MDFKRSKISEFPIFSVIAIFFSTMPSRFFSPLQRCRNREPPSHHRSRDNSGFDREMHSTAMMINRSNRSDEHSDRRVEKREELDFFRLRSIDKENNECTVCMRSFEIDGVVSLLRCGHYFCQECAVQWFEGMNATNCPLCRCEVTAIKSDEEQEDENNSYLRLRETHQYHCRLVRSNFLEEVVNSSNTMINCPKSGDENGDVWAGLVQQASDGLPCGGGYCLPFSTASNNFDLIMAKALRAQHARQLAMDSNTKNQILGNDAGRPKDFKNK